MTGCDRFREALLDAEPDALRGAGDTALAAHVRECDACRTAAERILLTNARLDEALSAAPPVDAATLVARARLRVDDGRGSRGQGAGEESRPDERSVEPPRTARRPLRRTAVGLALAAGLAALVLGRGSNPPLPGDPVEPAPPSYALVEAGADANVAVFETADPDITVLWFF